MTMTHSWMSTPSSTSLRAWVSRQSPSGLSRRAAEKWTEIRRYQIATSLPISLTEPDNCRESQKGAHAKPCVKFARNYNIKYPFVAINLVSTAIAIACNAVNKLACVQCIRVTVIH